MLSRKIIVLQANDSGYIDYDWLYNMSKQIYNKITLYNKEYAKFLHDKGFISRDLKTKKFKLFNFSLIFDNQKMNKEGIYINKNDNINLVISGYNEVINAILQGIIINNEFKLNNILFKTVNIQNDSKVRFNKINIYKALTPIVESKWNDGVKYLNPYDPKYYNAIKQNLKRKYEIIYDKPYNGILKIMIENMLKVKKKTFNIKNDSYVQGYGKFEMLVQADNDMQKVAYYCGLGEKNSIGAGFLVFITGGE